jgi:tripeptide aminopeptidase
MIPTKNKKEVLVMDKVNRSRLIATFCELAKIASPSGTEDQIADVLVDKLTSLGLKVVRDNYGNVIASLAGEGEPLILCAHMDTVPIGTGSQISPIVEDDIIRSDRSTILGADNKDSIAAILEALTIVKEGNLKNRALEVVLTRDEEVISLGVKNLDYSLIKGKKAIIADAEFPYGSVILSAPFNFTFDVAIEGRRSHVSKPENGLNALTLALECLKQIKLGSMDEFTRVNISGGIFGLEGVLKAKDFNISNLAKARNTVPDFVLLHGEVRGAVYDPVERNLNQIKSVFENTVKELGGKISFTSKKLADGYLYEETHPLVAEVKKVFLSQQVQPQCVHSFGGSDANFLIPGGIQTVVVSSPNILPHSVAEHLKISDLVLLADFYLKLSVLG